MKVFEFSIDEAVFFGEDDDNVDTVADEIANRLNISSSDVYVVEVDNEDE